MWVWVRDSLSRIPPAETFSLVLCDSITTGLPKSSTFENVECAARCFSSGRAGISVGVMHLMQVPASWPSI